MKNKTSSLFLADPSFDSKDFFQKFSDRRSWEPGWLADYRKEKWENFLNFRNQDLKDERWRFSSRSRLDYSKVEKVTESDQTISVNESSKNGITLDTLGKVILEQPSLLSEITNLSGPNLGADESFLLASTFSESGFFLKVDKGTTNSAPLFVDHTAPSSGEVSFSRNLLVLEPHSEVTLIERMASTTISSDGFVTNLTNAIIGEGAKLRRIVIQDFNDKVTLHNLENFDLLKDAQLTNVYLHLGSAEARLETKGSMLGSGAEFENFSLALGREDQLIDLRTMQHHLASNCRSNLVCKNALLNKSKSIFSGMIKVENKARCSDALQTNRNLLMSEEAVADSIPGLEISANEVKCSHGATTSRIDEQELFYLLSRGIKPNHAEKLIALGFFEEVVEKIVLEEQMEIARNLISQKFDS